MRKFSLFRKRGFTLVELLVVIAIIGILASIVFVNVKSIREKAKRAAALQSFEQISLAMNMFWEGNWPPCNEPECSYSYGPSNPPPFVDAGIYPNWNATYYCSDCQYMLYLSDNDGDSKIGCAFMYIRNTNWSIYIYKNILCEDCSNCGYSDYRPY